MDIAEFKHQRITGREQLLKKIVDTFKPLSPLAIHQFGSGAQGFKDEFSDLDIWITFKDSQINTVLKQISQIFGSIAPVLIKHHSKSWSPVGGSSFSIIHHTESGLFVVDYYISKFSQTVIKKDSLVLFGDDSLKRGDLRLNKNLDKNIHDSHTQKKDIDLLLDLIFISTKGIVRKWPNDDFINTLKTVHRRFRKRYPGKIKRRYLSLNFKSNYRLLSDLYKISNQRQRQAIKKIRKYLQQVNNLY